MTNLLKYWHNCLSKLRSNIQPLIKMGPLYSSININWPRPFREARILKNSLKYRLMFQQSIPRLFSGFRHRYIQRPIYINRWIKWPILFKGLHKKSFLKRNLYKNSTNFHAKINFSKNRKLIDKIELWKCSFLGKRDANSWNY